MSDAMALPLTPANIPVQVSEDNLRQVLELLNRRFGFQCRAGFQEMARNRMVRRLLELGLDNLKDYYYRLLYDTQSDSEIETLFDMLANNETYFFREEAQIWSLAEEVIPERTDGRPDSRVRVWSAGCSSGEEAYSLAMAVLEKQPQRTGQVEIFASDQSKRVLERARTGVYSGFSFRALPDELKQRHFSHESGERYRINPTVRRMVQFGRCNLIGQAGDLPLVKFDAIYCRNVLIYFDKDSRRRVIDLFHDRLAEGGYLFLGHSESLLDLSDRFELASLMNNVAYRR